MQRIYGVAGASAAVAAIGLVVASQTGLFSKPDEQSPAAAVEVPAAAPASEVAIPDPTVALHAEIDRLTADLAERSAAYDALAATVQAKDADVARITAQLAERDKEITDLRAQLAELQEQVKFDAALTALKSEVGTGDARLEVARAEVAATGVPSGAPAAPVARALSEIHFDPSSSRLSPGGQAHAAAAAVTLQDMGGTRIRIVGYTDRVGGPARNRTLAETRAKAVADFLISAGLPKSAIEIVGMGEADVPVATADGVAEPLNRCVTIEVVPL